LSLICWHILTILQLMPIVNLYALTNDTESAFLFVLETLNSSLLSFSQKNTSYTMYLALLIKNIFAFFKNKKIEYELSKIFI
jgi:hypothetical protein